MGCQSPASTTGCALSSAGRNLLAAASFRGCEMAVSRSLGEGAEETKRRLDRGWTRNMLGRQ